MHGLWLRSKKRKGKISQYFKTLLQLNGLYVVQCERKNMRGQQTGKWLWPARGTAAKPEGLRGRIQTGKHPKRPQKKKILRQFRTKRTDQQNPLVPRVFTLCAAVFHTRPPFRTHCTTEHILSQQQGTIEASGTIHTTDTVSHPRRPESSRAPPWFDSTVRSSNPGRASKGNSCFTSFIRATAGTETRKTLSLHLPVRLSFYLAL